MNARHPRREPSRSIGAIIHRGPQAAAPSQQSSSGVVLHAPNAALLIDFDNVTMGIRSDLGKELRSLLSSDIIKGKVAVQRAYADWRRYPGYIVPLTENSIDLIWAPAYGSAKKNATDIRLAVDAIELVFTRPEIGTFILLSGDSDFSSLVIKLKEYGKYVIGVGIRESSSDLLVMNCDEYYSYNALAGLVKAGDEESGRTYDPWELVSEAIQRMKRNGDVMRSDRLKQVMQDIDSSFDEKNTGHSKFSKFVTDAAARGLLTLTKLENGQLDVSAPTTDAAKPTATPAAAEATSAGESAEPTSGTRRGRRGGRGRGRGRSGASAPSTPVPTVSAEAPTVTATAPVHAPPVHPARVAEPAVDATSMVGERLTRDEAFELVRRAVETLTTSDETVHATAVRQRAHELLARDSESLTERNFARILRDAHDANVIDLRRRGDDFDVSRAASAAPVADQLALAAAASAPPAPVVAAGPRLGMGPRGGGGRSGGARGRGGPPPMLPPELLSVGVIAPAPASVVVEAESPKGATRPRRSGVSRRPTAKPDTVETEGVVDAEKKPRTRRGRGGKAAKSEA